MDPVYKFETAFFSPLIAEYCGCILIANAQNPLEEAQKQWRSAQTFLAMMKDSDHKLRAVISNDFVYWKGKFEAAETTLNVVHNLHTFDKEIVEPLKGTWNSDEVSTALARMKTVGPALRRSEDARDKEVWKRMQDAAAETAKNAAATIKGNMDCTGNAKNTATVTNVKLASLETCEGYRYGAFVTSSNG